jgi:uncharacterized membrane protein
VQLAAPTWPLVEEHIKWAKDLAFNIGVYNLILAIGLAWTCRAFATQSAMADSLGVFFAIWLLGAAAAALYTRVWGAFVLQGIFGILLLFASNPDVRSWFAAGKRI